MNRGAMPPIEKGSDAQNERGRRQGYRSGRRAVVEEGLRAAQGYGLDRNNAEHQRRCRRRHVRSSGGGRRCLPHHAVVRAAVVFGVAVDLRYVGRPGRLSTRLTRAMVCHSRARRLTHRRAHHPRDRQAGHDRQQHDGDAMSPLHGSSISPSLTVQWLQAACASLPQQWPPSPNRARVARDGRESSTRARSSCRDRSARG
jgi:hypothetical protein